MGSHQNPCTKTGRTCRITQSVAKKTVSEIDATSCKRTDESSRYPLLWWHVQQVFSKIWENLSSRREVHKRVGKPLVHATPMMPRVRAVQEGHRQSSAQRGVSPWYPPPPSFSHPLILSVTPSLAPAANLKQQVPTPLLRGSRSPSGFLLPVADVYARGEGFPLLEKFRGFCWWASLLRGVSLARECRKGWDGLICESRKTTVFTRNKTRSFNFSLSLRISALIFHFYDSIPQHPFWIYNNWFRVRKFMSFDVFREVPIIMR